MDITTIVHMVGGAVTAVRSMPGHFDGEAKERLYVDACEGSDGDRVQIWAQRLHADLTSPVRPPRTYERHGRLWLRLAA